MANSSEIFILLCGMCNLNMHWICCAKNFEIKMCFNQTIKMFLSEELTSLPKDKCRIGYKNTWHMGHCFSSKIA